MPQALVLAAPDTQRIVLESLQERYRVVCLGSMAVRDEILRLSPDELSRAHVLVTPGGNPTPRSALQSLPNLRLIACTGSGYDGLDMGYVRETNISVTNCPEVNASSVAEIAVGLLIASTRRMFEANRVLRTSGFVRPWPATMGLHAHRAGIYGLGAIGAHLAKCLAAMEMQVGYCARRRRTNVPYLYFNSLLSLAHWSDALIVCVPATNQTVRSVDATVLAALGPRGHLINVSRASIVDAAALCTYLEQQATAGAGLDVCDPEYLPRLLALPNVTVTPHIGGSTMQAEAAIRDLVLGNVAAHFAGTSLLTPVENGLPVENEARGG